MLIVSNSHIAHCSALTEDTRYGFEENLGVVNFVRVLFWSFDSVYIFQNSRVSRKISAAFFSTAFGKVFRISIS
jgi:hypothetical protein